MSSSSSSSNQEERHRRRPPMFIFILVSLAFFQIGVLISVSNSNLHNEERINNELVLDNDNDVDVPNADAATRIPVFYNVFTGSEESIPRVKNIVKEQFSQLRPEQHEVFVRSDTMKMVTRPKHLHFCGSIVRTIRIRLTRVRRSSICIPRGLSLQWWQMID